MNYVRISCVKEANALRAEGLNLAAMSKLVYLHLFTAHLRYIAEDREDQITIQKGRIVVEDVI